MKFFDFSGFDVRVLVADLVGLSSWELLIRLPLTASTCFGLSAVILLVVRVKLEPLEELSR